ncbi:MAG: DNA adenine methylase [Patescibacteria group bacterium]|nr:DNA adenine methylase [Patescibacteria group bacterium]
MKYMGSKRYMLNNGLGMLIKKRIIDYNRFVDLFCGAGYVSYFVAENFSLPVLASDLQVYATTLTGAVIERTSVVNTDKLESVWINIAEGALKKSELYKRAKLVESRNVNKIEILVKKSRLLCGSTKSNIGPIWKAYGGHYFSPTQALAIDYLIKNIPSKSKVERTLCLAALVDAASKCVASPGHTAQPFQPTHGAKKFLYQSWQLDLFQETKEALKKLSQLKAQRRGRVVTCAAEDLIGQLSSRDLIFIDPPYSGVQYSRFYHVLETIARKQCGLVEGVGRYPSLVERPQSAYSNKSTSGEVLKNLMEKIARKKASVIFTFPNKECSNGLSGKTIKEIVKTWFHIEEECIHGYFSTLGGNNKKDNRPYRQKSEELLLFLKPR